MKTTYITSYLAEDDAKQAVANYAQNHYTVVLIGPTSKVSAKHESTGVAWPKPGAEGFFLVVATLDHVSVSKTAQPDG